MTRNRQMGRLIDADALATAIYEWMPKDQETWMESDIPPIENLVVSIMMTIEEQPTIDAEPVKHGKWTADETLYTGGMTACSCCKTEYYRDDLYMVGNDAQGEPPNYCPNCGARMDAE